MLRGYNAGPGAVEKSHKYKETNDFVDKVTKNLDEYTGGKSGGVDYTELLYRLLQNHLMRGQLLPVGPK